MIALLVVLGSWAGIAWLVSRADLPEDPLG